MSLSYLLQTPPITTVIVVRLSQQGYGEIHPDFIMQKFNELGTNWCIISQSGLCHNLKFNKNYDHPALLTGWEELIQYHQLPNDVEIDFAFYGNNRFSLISFKEPTVAEDIHPFHSRSLCPNATVHFDIVLDPSNTNKKQLALPSEFGNYLQMLGYKWIMIRGDDLFHQAVAVTTKNNCGKTKINSWNTICKDLEFKIGDTIRFKFVVNDPHHIAHIYKAYPYRSG